MKYCKTHIERYSPYCSIEDETRYYYYYAAKEAVSLVTLQTCYRNILSNKEKNGKNTLQT